MARGMKHSLLIRCPCKVYTPGQTVGPLLSVEIC